MTITYETLTNDDIGILRNLCNELMKFQKTKAYITPERFDDMSFETRLVSSVKNARDNYFIVVKNSGQLVAYAYSNICNKKVYESGMFGKFFEMDSVDGDYVGCLSQFFVQDKYRSKGIGSVLFKESIAWINSFDGVKDIFIYVSNGNDDALRFYKSKGFTVSHDILDGFITVIRNK